MELEATALVGLELPVPKGLSWCGLHQLPPLTQTCRPTTDPSPPTHPPACVFLIQPLFLPVSGLSPEGLALNRD